MRIAGILACLASAAWVAVCHAREPEVPRWLQGVWTRAWIEQHGRRMATFEVHYLQTPSLYGDVRIPIDRPAMAHAHSFADLSDDELRALARQLGFSGSTTVAGDRATWSHLVDYQPTEGEPDVGRLERLGSGRMSEHAPDGSYMESWQSSSDGRGRFLAISTEVGGRIRRLLLVAGDDFLYVRNRASDLPPAASLEALLDVPGTTRSQAIAYLDCEMSYGEVRGAATTWEIKRSTLPWREGHHLDFIDLLQPGIGQSGVSLRSPGDEQLTVLVDTLSYSKLLDLLAAGTR